MENNTYPPTSTLVTCYRNFDGRYGQYRTHILRLNELFHLASRILEAAQDLAVGSFNVSDSAIRTGATS